MSITISTIKHAVVLKYVNPNAEGKTRRIVVATHSKKPIWGRLEDTHRQGLINILGRAVELSGCKRVAFYLVDVGASNVRPKLQKFIKDLPYDVDGILLPDFRTNEWLENSPKRAEIFNNYLTDTEYGVPVVPTVNLVTLFRSDAGFNVANFVCEAALSLLNGKQFRTITKELPKIRMVDTPERFEKFYKQLTASQITAIDTEALSLERITATVITAQFTLDNQITYLLPLLHKEATWTEQQLQRIRTKLRFYLEFGKTKHLIFHAAKFDLSALKAFTGFEYINHRIYDTGAGEYALDENIRDLQNDGLLGLGKFSLAQIENLYGFHRPKGLDVDKESRKDMSRFTLEQMKMYACLDTWTIWHIAKAQQRIAKFYGDEFFEPTVCDIIGRLNICFHNLEYNGVHIDFGWLLQLANRGTGPLSEPMNAFIKELRDIPEVQKASRELAVKQGLGSANIFGKKQGVSFDPDSREHLEHLFIKTMKLEPVAFTKTGLISIGKAFFAEYKKNPIVAKFSEYVKQKKLRSAFVDSLLKKCAVSADYKKDGNLRASYDYRRVVTGRSSSHGPSFQQLPAHGKLAALIARQFVARKGTYYWKVDFSSHEVRGLCNVSHDKAMATTYEQMIKYKTKYRLEKDPAKRAILEKNYDAETDQHILNVYKFYGLKVNKKHPLRQGIKSVVFGVIYGKGVAALGRDLKSQIRKRPEIEEDLTKVNARIKELKKLVGKEQPLKLAA